MSRHGIRKKAGSQDLRAAFLRDERSVQAVFEELSFESQGFRQGQSQAEAPSKTTGKEALHSECCVEEKVGHHAKCSSGATCGH